MGVAVSVAGWVAACLATIGALIAFRLLDGRTAAVARACHELRGPLTAARLGLQLGLDRGHASPALLRALELELGQAGLALDDLADVRDGRSAPGSVRGRDEVDIDELVSASVDAWRASAAARGVPLRLHRSLIGARVTGERLRLAQATGNLIVNAIEHGGGIVDVSVRLAGPTVVIEIVDHGPGLPAPLSELVSRRRSGRDARGHGLVITTHVARQHGGRLSSAPASRGARLVLALPACGPPARQAVARDAVHRA